MSTLWLIGTPDPFLNEFYSVLSGQFAIRRVISPKNFARLMALEPKAQLNTSICILKVCEDDDCLALHSAIARMTKMVPPKQICLIGNASDAQRKIFASFQIAYLGVPENFQQIAKTLRLLQSIEHAADTITHNAAIFRIGDLEILREQARLRILATGYEESLTPKEIRILQILSSQPNKTISRSELVEQVWASTHVSTSTVDSHMSRLRRKIEPSFECKLETIYGSGWSLVTKHL